jgi:hypothetical protein
MTIVVLKNIRLNETVYSWALLFGWLHITVLLWHFVWTLAIVFFRFTVLEFRLITFRRRILPPCSEEKQKDKLVCWASRKSLIFCRTLTNMFSHLLKIFLAFTKSEGSLYFSHQATSNTIFFKIHFNIILPAALSRSNDLWLKLCTQFSYIVCVCSISLPFYHSWKGPMSRLLVVFSFGRHRARILSTQKRHVLWNKSNIVSAGTSFYSGFPSIYKRLTGKYQQIKLNEC